MSISLLVGIKEFIKHYGEECADADAVGWSSLHILYIVCALKLVIGRWERSNVMQRAWLITIAAWCIQCTRYGCSSVIISLSGIAAGVMFSFVLARLTGIHWLIFTLQPFTVLDLRSWSGLRLGQNPSRRWRWVLNDVVGLSCWQKPEVVRTHQ